MATQTGGIDLKAMKKAHDQALAAAEAIEQFFWHNSQDSGAGEGVGAHITEVPQEDYIADPANGGGNLLAQSGGIAIRDGLKELATFGASGAIIGEVANDNVRVDISPNAFKLINRRFNTDVEETHIGYGEVQGGSGPTNGMFFSFGRRDYATLDYDDYPGVNWKVGDLCIHNGKEYACISDTTGAWDSSKWWLSIGRRSLAAGTSPIAAGADSIAFNSTALGFDSFAAGTENIAVGLSQTVIGRFNAPTGTPDSGDTSDPAFIIGNGVSDVMRDNALTVDWGGNVEAAGSITASGHRSAIGYKTARQTGTYSLASGTSWVTVPAANLSRITLGAGTWIIHAHASFESNNTGRRSLQIYSITEGGELTRSTVNQTATNGSATNMQTSAIVVPTENTTYTVRVAQNSGSAKSVDLILEAVRIA